MKEKGGPADINRDACRDSLPLNADEAEAAMSATSAGPAMIASFGGPAGTSDGSNARAKLPDNDHRKVNNNARFVRFLI